MAVEDPSKEKVYVRGVTKIDGWNVPANNLLQKYLEACEQRRATAQTGVAAQLLQRVRGMQPLPYHKVTGKTWADVVPLLVQHLDPAGCGRVPANVAQAAVGMINPRLPWDDAVALGSPSLAEDAARRQRQIEELKRRDHRAYMAYMQNEPPPVVTTEQLGLILQAAADSALAGAHDHPSLRHANPSSGTQQQHGHGAGSADHDQEQEQPEAAAAAEEEQEGGGSSHQERYQAELQQILAEVEAGLMQGALEVLAFPTPTELAPGAELSGTSAAAAAAPLLGVLFDHLDRAGQGSIPVPEARAVVQRFLPDGSDIAKWELQPLTRGLHMQVQRDEFLAMMLDTVVPGCGLPLAKVFGTVQELLDHKIKPHHEYDFSRDYLGPAGLVPLIDTLRHDTAFVGLNLSRSGICDSACIMLCDWLKDHPSITSLDLSHNPIGDRGGVALALLLDANPRISQLNIQGIHLLRKFSRTHHDTLGPSACEDGGHITSALQRNQATQKRQASELVRLLRGFSMELKVLFFALASQKTGKIDLPLLQSELREIGAAWGFEQSTIDEVVLSERLLGTGGKVPDDGGVLRISFSEFMLFLETQDQIARVMHAVRHHRLEVKRVFFELAAAAEGGQDSAQAGPSSSGNVFMSVLKEELKRMAAAPGSGWGVAMEDLEVALLPSLFARHAPLANPPLGAPPAGAAPEEAEAAGAGTAGDEGGAGDGDVEVQFHVHNSPKGYSAGHGHGGRLSESQVVEQDVLLSWPAFFNTVLFLLNR